MLGLAVSSALGTWTHKSHLNPVGLVCSYYAYSHKWKPKHRDIKKFNQGKIAYKPQGWELNLGRVYPFNHGTVVLLYGRNIWVPLGTVLDDIISAF